MLPTLSTPTKLVLGGQVLALAWSMYKGNRLMSLATIMTIGGILLSESKKKPGEVVSNFGQLRAV